MMKTTVADTQSSSPATSNIVDRLVPLDEDEYGQGIAV